MNDEPPATTDPGRALCRPHADLGARCARRRRPARRRPDAAAELLREPRLPGLSRGRPGRRRQVLSARALERCADPRGARVRRRARARRRSRSPRRCRCAADAARRTRRRSPSPGATLALAAIERPRLPLRRLRTPRRPRARARRPRSPPLARPLHRPAPRRRRDGAVRPSDHARRRQLRRRQPRLPARRRHPAADDVADTWLALVDAALAACREAFAAAPPRKLRLHGDCHLGNILWTERGPHFVDLDDAVNGPAMQDLWMLLSGDRAAMSRQLLDVLEGYEVVHGLRLARGCA